MSDKEFVLNGVMEGVEPLRDDIVSNITCAPAALITVDDLQVDKFPNQIIFAEHDGPVRVRYVAIETLPPQLKELIRACNGLSTKSSVAKSLNELKSMFNVDVDD